MTGLLEFKARVIHFYEKYEAYIVPVLRFFFALAAFLLINQRLGYMERVNNIFIPLILAVACSVLPVNATVVAAALLVLVNLYALSLEACGVGALLFLICFLLFFRLAPKQGFQAVLAPLLSVFKISYLLPIADGLLWTPYSLVSTMCGTVIYYFLKGVKYNELIFESSQEDGMTSKLVVAVNQIVGNKDLYLALLAILVTGLVVYLIRRLSVEHSWFIAIMAGSITQFLIYLVGYLLFGESAMMIWLVVGMIVSVLIAFAIQFFMFHLDYTRTERVQFEDDNYYYYVKAVPKALVNRKEKKITKISSGKNITKESLAKEFDIDKNLLN